MDLYHADIRLPDGFVKPTGRVMLRWTRHAEHARKTDRYGEIRAFKSATLDRLDVIEVGVEDITVKKIVFRGRYDDTRDVVMVLIPNGTAPWTVKTVWFNMRDDIHKTLDKTKYVR